MLLLLSMFFAYLLAPAVDMVSRTVRPGRRGRPLSRGASLALIYAILSVPVALAWRFASDPIARWVQVTAPEAVAHLFGGGDFAAIDRFIASAPVPASARPLAEAPRRERHRLHPAACPYHARHADRRRPVRRMARRDAGAGGAALERLAELSTIDAARAAARASAMAGRGVPPRRQQRDGGIHPRAGGGRRDRRVAVRRRVRDDWRAVRRCRSGSRPASSNWCPASAR